MEVLKRAYGTVDNQRLERLRAVEPNEVGTLADRIQNMNGSEALVREFQAIADAARETMMARRAAHRIDKDISGVRDPSKRMEDERAAIDPLSTSEALQQLMTFESDDRSIASEARAIGILMALERMEDARGLPKHMKVYAVQGPYQAIFGVKPPPAPEDPKAPLKAGAWLAYLSQTATAAGHPLPYQAKTIQQRELMAWNSVAEGMADKLRMLAPQMPNDDVREATLGAMRRLDTQFRSAETVVLAADRFESTSRGAGLALVLRAASCWLPDTFSDAFGESGQARALGQERRCGDFASIVYDDPDDAMGAMDALRNADPLTETAFEDKVARFAERDAIDSARKNELLGFARTLSRAANEHARVRSGIAIIKWGDDKPSAIPLLEDRTALTQLLDFDAGSLSTDAHATGLLFAIERFEMARVLPPRYQLYAIAGPISKLFAVMPPRMPDDLMQPFSEIELDNYLRQAAKAAGHPLAPETQAGDIERAARISILFGLADRLRQRMPGLDPPLDDAARVTTTRLASEYSTIRNRAIR